MLFDFKDMCPIKKAYYFGKFIGYVVAKCQSDEHVRPIYLVRTIKDLEDFTPWLGKERSDIPEKYQTYDGYWFFVEDPIKKNFRMKSCEFFGVE